MPKQERRTQGFEVDRKRFEAMVRKLLAAPATSTRQVSEKIKLRSRSGALTRALIAKPR